MYDNGGEENIAEFLYIIQEHNRRIILRWIFREWEGVLGTGWSWLRIGTGGGRL
jgi:hypothetical protein